MSVLSNLEGSHASAIAADAGIPSERRSKCLNHWVACQKLDANHALAICVAVV
jgi:hypothetical protein